MNFIYHHQFQVYMGKHKIILLQEMEKFHLSSFKIIPTILLECLILRSLWVKKSKMLNTE